MRLLVKSYLGLNFFLTYFAVRCKRPVRKNVRRSVKTLENQMDDIHVM